jgi:ABC-type transport system involved in multi-copper enzyme maturation permease subunit
LNPVLGREVRERMRGGRAFAAITAYLAVLVLVTWLVHQGTRTSANDFVFDVSERTAQGRTLFEWLVFFMVLLVLFLVPGITAGAIAGERERQTLSTLQLTLLRPAQILWGKVTSSLAFVLLLVVATAPLFAVAFMLGGISVGQAAKGLAGVILVAFLVAIMVVALSALTRRVQTATVLAYALSFILAVGSFVAYGILMAIDESRGDDDGDPPAWVLAPNPIVLVADLASGTVDENSNVDTPLRGIARFVQDAQQPDQDFQDDPFGDDVVVVGGLDGDDPFPMWVASTLSLAGLAALLFGLGLQRVKTPAASER